VKHGIASTEQNHTSSTEDERAAFDEENYEKGRNHGKDGRYGKRPEQTPIFADRH
jgi:hypothetical protein